MTLPWWIAAGNRDDVLAEALETAGIARQMPPPDPVPLTGTIMVGLTDGINREPDPLVMLVRRPLDDTLQDFSTVLIGDSGWPSIDGHWWPIRITDRQLSQFRLVGANTSGEQGTGVGATVSILTAGGGSLNGTASTVLLKGQAGTAANRGSVPRANLKAGGGNYCGTV
jgi:hypothetical protein